jgi:hypothetical protein
MRNGLFCAPLALSRPFTRFLFRHCSCFLSLSDRTSFRDLKLYIVREDI